MASSGTGSLVFINCLSADKSGMKKSEVYAALSYAQLMPNTLDNTSQCSCVNDPKQTLKTTWDNHYIFNHLSWNQVSMLVTLIKAIYFYIQGHQMIKVNLLPFSWLQCFLKLWKNPVAVVAKNTRLNEPKKDDLFCNTKFCCFTMDIFPWTFIFPKICIWFTWNCQTIVIT